MGSLAGVFDLFFPDRCVGCGEVGSYFCNNCLGKIQPVDHQICPYCKKDSITGKTHPVCSKRCSLDGLASGFYHQGPIKKATHLLKYQLITHLQDSLGKKLLLSLENQRINFSDFVLVPIPLHYLKERKRGFNQALILAMPLVQKWGITLEQKLLKRTKNTISQVNLTEEERQANLEGAFEAARSVPEKVVLVDDVFTTGATMFNAAKVLKKAGATEVWGLTLARAQKF